MEKSVLSVLQAYGKNRGLVKGHRHSQGDSVRTSAPAAAPGAMPCRAVRPCVRSRRPRAVRRSVRRLQ